ncbi:unnamed protein product [Bemisia tabaci]|uniref:Beta/gamma crystallin 'Greek key' domain-containing protein n=1 Tax=Bemisia tabaci TaxID=7038 RepID=A0A9P0A1B3_BEMTA|nr:unnamed protein product [Bemisia tabaci]
MQCVVIFSVVLSAVLFSADAWRATLHRDSGFRGGSIDVSGNGCVNVGKDFNDRTSSVNTHGGCIRIYQHGNCLGDMKELFPGSAAHDNLRALGFNDKLTSIGPCPRRRREVPYSLRK